MGRTQAKLIVLVLLVLLAGLVTPAATAAPVQQTSSAGVVAAQAALSKRGFPYVWGAKGPSAFDCSGLASWAWRQAGYSVGISTYDQAAAGVRIDCNLSNLSISGVTCWQPGDLIFLRYSGGQHVAIYAGNGLFVDAYHPSTGVILHNVAADDFYQANFWQARRITSDNAGAIDPGGADNQPAVIPGLEDIPDIMGQVSFQVPQCGACNPDGSILLPPREWGESWPAGWEALNLTVVFQRAISWLSWQVGEFIRQLICWLLSMLATLASILAAAANTLIYGVNALFKLGVLMWLSLKAYFLAFWEILESIRQLLASVAGGLGGLAEFGRLVIEVVLLIAALIGRVLALLGQLGLALLGLVGWIGGLVLGFIGAIQLALAGTETPVQLSGTHIIYQATRGIMEGVRDSEIGWVFVVLWAMAYVAAITWLAKFLSVKGEA